MTAVDPAIRRVAVLIPQIAKNLRAPVLLDRARPGLTMSQLLTLLVLDEADRASLSMSEIAGELGVTLPTATGLVDRLVREKLVVRKSSDEDRRIVLVMITRQGSAVIRRELGVLDGLVTKLLSGMTEAEKRSLANAAERVFELSVMVREEERGIAAGTQGRSSARAEISE